MSSTPQFGQVRNGRTGEKQTPGSSYGGATVTQRYLDISMTIFKETLNDPFLLEKERGKTCFRDPHL